VGAALVRRPESLATASSKLVPHLSLGNQVIRNWILSKLAAATHTLLLSKKFHQLGLFIAHALRHFTTSGWIEDGLKQLVGRHECGSYGKIATKELASLANEATDFGHCHC
jgi:hypothetical protein